MQSIDWIAIAQIGIPSLVAVLIGYWQVKTMRGLAKSIPSEGGLESQTKISNDREAIKWYHRLFMNKFYWFSFIAYLLVDLYIQVHSQDPLTRKAVLLIAGDFFLILYTWTAYTSLSSGVRLMKYLDQHIDAEVSIFKTVAGNIEMLKKSVHPPFQGGT